MPVKGNSFYCPDPECNRKQPEIHRLTCEACGSDLSAPNVNTVNTKTEKTELLLRYKAAEDYLTKSGPDPIPDRFETHFNANGNAIINPDPNLLCGWVGQQTAAYKPYGRAVDEGLRPVASLFKDRKRIVIDSSLYGSSGRDIVYATLTLNNERRQSYGGCRAILNEDAIKYPASALENIAGIRKTLFKNGEECFILKSGGERDHQSLPTSQFDLNNFSLISPEVNSYLNVEWNFDQLLANFIKELEQKKVYRGAYASAINFNSWVN